MDVRGFQVAQAGDEKSAGSGAPFLSGNERALSSEVAPCRPQVVAAGTVRDAGVIKNLVCNKDLDFRIYFAIIRSALAV